MIKRIMQINEWNGDRSRCEISSILWATILLTNTSIKFADGHVMDFAPAICDLKNDSEWVRRTIEDGSYKIDNQNLPEEERTINAQNVFDGAIFKVVSAEKRDDLYIRIRAYHRHDGTEYGHPGIMSLEAVDLREWVAIYSMLDKRVKELWRAQRDEGGQK